MELLAQGGIAEPAATGGFVAVAFALVKVAEVLISKRTGGNGYAKAEQLGRVEMTVNGSAAQISLLMERHKTGNELSREQLAVLREIQLQLERRAHDCPAADRLHRITDDIEKFTREKRC